MRAHTLFERHIVRNHCSIGSQTLSFTSVAFFAASLVASWFSASAFFTVAAVIDFVALSASAVLSFALSAPFAASSFFSLGPLTALSKNSLMFWPGCLWYSLMSVDHFLYLNMLMPCTSTRRNYRCICHIYTTGCQSGICHSEIPICAFTCISMSENESNTTYLVFLGVVHEIKATTLLWYLYKNCCIWIILTHCKRVKAQFNTWKCHLPTRLTHYAKDVNRLMTKFPFTVFTYIYGIFPTLEQIRLWPTYGGVSVEMATNEIRGNESS